MSYSDYIKINETFKTSVNIEFDLLNNDKLLKYIPTSDVCEVLKYYFDSFEDNKYNRSTILEGPYGKGKSYLILSLLQIITLDKNDASLKEFIAKLKTTNPDFAKQVKKLKSTGFKLLPVIVNSNYAHLNQSLNIALRDALVRNGLEDLLPNTAYEVALEIIKRWQNFEDVNNKAIKECIKTVNVSLNELVTGLSNYSQEYYEKFLQLYSCVNRTGQDFNPFTNDDVVKNYEDIAHKAKDYGFNGLFIVFDEFSKFIESDNTSLTMDLKILQDLSEKVSRSGDVQLHLCCITHKSLNSYYRNRKSDIANSLKTVEGRFREIRFNRSLNQNYEIIALTLNRTEGTKTRVNGILRDNEFVYSNLEPELFGNTKRETVVEGCFPMNPYAVYAAIQVSERIAQNERTLFTLISDTDPNSFASFLRGKNQGLYNVDNIYDYFSTLLEKSEDEEIKSLSYRTQASLIKLDDALSISIIKALCIIRLINNSDGYPAKAEMLAKAVAASLDETNIRIENLEKLALIKKSFSTGCYDFAISGGKEIEEQINSILTLKSKQIDIVNVLNELYVSYELPRRYNAEYKITRFFRNLYIKASDLINLTSFEVLFEKYNCDGLVLNLILDMPVATERILHNKTDADRVVVKVPQRNLSDAIINEIKRISALRMLISSSNMSDDEKEEVRLIVEDETYELSEVLNDIYDSKKVNIVSKSGGFNLYDVLSNTFERVFYKTPIVNNEMINKNAALSVQYLKPRNQIAEMYLEGKLEEIDSSSSTGPLATVFNSFNTEESNTSEVLSVIKDLLSHSENNRCSFEELINTLVKKPYGIRKGVLPILIAIAIYQMNVNVIMYFGKKEIPLNAENIAKAIDKPDKYLFELERGSNEKIEYLENLSEIFDVVGVDDFGAQLILTSESLQKWIFGLPKIVRSCTKNSNYLDLDEKFFEMKEVFYTYEINPYEAIFKKLPNIFESYDEVIDFISSFKDSVMKIINGFEEDISAEIKNMFDANRRASLMNIFNDFISENRLKDRYLESKEKIIVSCFDDLTYDDNYCLNKLSLALFKTKITDWERNRKEELLWEIDNFIKSAPTRRLENNAAEIVVEHRELSGMGKLLMNQILDSFDEFNDSVSNEEKAQIISEILKKIANK